MTIPRLSLPQALEMRRRIYGHGERASHVEVALNLAKLGETDRARGALATAGLGKSGLRTLGLLGLGGTGGISTHGSRLPLLHNRLQSHTLVPFECQL